MLPMIRKIINKPWNVFQINPKLQETFQNNLFVAFKRNKTLQEIIGGHTIKNGRVFKAHSKSRKGKYEPGNTSKQSLCCKQAIDTSTFRSYQTQQLYRTGEMDFKVEWTRNTGKSCRPPWLDGEKKF